MTTIILAENFILKARGEHIPDSRPDAGTRKYEVFDVIDGEGNEACINITRQKQEELDSALQAQGRYRVSAGSDPQGNYWALHI